MRDFYHAYPESEPALKSWYSEVSRAEWKNPHEVRRAFPRVSILGNETAVFDVCHNRFRLAVNIVYAKQWVFVAFIGNHKEYDQWNRTRQN